MDAASKLKAWLWPGSSKNRPSSVREIPPVDPPAAKPEEPASERQHDRWFVEQRGGQKFARRLEIPNEVRVESGGPLEFRGNITLIDEDGNRSHHHELRLCRCGASQKRPVCDGRHLDVEFFDVGTISEASTVMPVKTPQSLMVTAVPGGPIKISGYIRIYNSRGQECLTRSAALCRCGKSTRKPFCDCQ